MKKKLRHLIEAGQELEGAALVPHVDDSAPPAPGRWTAKDQLAHLTAWRLVAASELDAIRTGAHLAALQTDEVENARIYAETHDQPASSVLAESRRSWDRLVSAVEACSDDDLEKPRARRPEQPAWQVIPGNTYLHIAAHLGYWSSERGDEATTESAAKWAYELATATFPEDSGRGTAAYNLGCFYAVRGRAEEALPHLRQGFELNPDLREWAKQDTDLDPIRSTPELARLLG